MNCHCGNILKPRSKYCSQKCYQNRNIEFDPAKAYTSLPYSDKYYYGAMQWGFDGNMESDRNRQNEEQVWSYQYPEPTRAPLDFDIENMLAAHMIHDAAEESGLEIQVLMSGGIDSTVMADTFRQAEIPFTPVTWRFTNGTNEHDIKHARKYCEKYNLNQKFIDIDIEDFLMNKSLDYCFQTQAINPGRALHGYIIDQLDGYPVFGNGAPYFYYDWSEKSKEYCVQTSEGESAQAAQKWLIYRDRPGCGDFFRWTTEQALSWLIGKHFWQLITFMTEAQDLFPIDNNLCGHPRNKIRRESEYAKHAVYKKYYPHLDTNRDMIAYEWQGTETRLMKNINAYTGYEYLTKPFRISNHIHKIVLPIQTFNNWDDDPVLDRIWKLLGISDVISKKIKDVLIVDIAKAQSDRSRVLRIKQNAKI